MRHRRSRHRPQGESISMGILDIQIRAYVSWGVNENVRSYESVFTYLVFSSRLFFYANMGKDDVAYLYLD